MIKMNRITRLLHKARFLSRHKRAISYSHRYVVTAEDLNQPDQLVEKDDPKAEIRYLVNDFDPATNKMDRCIYYEVMR